MVLRNPANEGEAAESAGVTRGTAGGARAEDGTVDEGRAEQAVDAAGNPVNPAGAPNPGYPSYVGDPSTPDLIKNAELVDSEVHPVDVGVAEQAKRDEADRG